MSGSGVCGGFMAGCSSKGCKKLHWGILCVHHLGDCWPYVLCECEFFLVCLGVFVLYVIVRYVIGRYVIGRYV